MKNKKVSVQDWGLIDYQAAWDRQEAIFASVVDQKVRNRREKLSEPTSNYLIFCEHPPVYTLGKSGKEEHLLLTHEELKQKGIHYYPINRGGDITFHGPGQIVCYPILDLDNFFTDIHKYLRLLEEAVILTLQEEGIAAGRIEGLTGVWLDHEDADKCRKICALGVKASRWVTMHGLAFNINTDLEYFKNIVPCGIDDKAVASLHLETKSAPDIKIVKQRLKAHIFRLFEMEEIMPSVLK
ncbi:MAG: lipoyl(octanoyl) transferase LipB [Cyclobacteriaceae bacterium]|nr:lipoyl(octanoyl) transferase LipB [Cyclobacteriaceae bacterium]MCH8516782.1 lipoyl(octanoyl) transferase LipB [Cyclobacteriaceae bacterium]